MATFISVTRLRIRSPLFMPGFAWLAFRSVEQTRRAAGFLGGRLLPDADRTFWTLTAWTDAEAMRAFMTAGPHRAAMPRLVDWCDEASVAHWTQDSDALPDWAEADARMRREGRPSRLRKPGPHHQDLSFAPPRTTASAPLAPAAARA
jgi:hypothetical protein